MLEKIKFLLSSAFQFLLPFIRILVSRTGELLMQTALDAVRAVAAEKDLTGSEKRDMAFEMIKKEMTAGGLSIAGSVINAAIEAAYLKYKSDV